MLETNAGNDSKQYIIVTLGIEQYGIDIQYVDNIVRMQKVTRVPKAQDFFLGVINLRGEIIPVMSLRKKFHYDADEFNDATRIIILKPEQQDMIGIVVDSVKEVLTLEDSCIEKNQYDSTNTQNKSKYVYGVGKNKDNLISLFNTINLINDISNEEKV